MRSSVAMEPVVSSTRASSRPMPWARRARFSTAIGMVSMPSTRMKAVGSVAEPLTVTVSRSGLTSTVGSGTLAPM